MAVLLLSSGDARCSPVFTDEESSSILAFGKALLVEHTGGQPAPQPPEAAKKRQMPCFVTFSIERQVVACFGSFTPRTSSLAEEIRANVRLALKNDQRAMKLTHNMAVNCDLQITFPSAPERISDWHFISPATEGLFVEREDGAGVAIVPGEARTANYAWKSALRRLGLKEGSSAVRLYRFRAWFISTRKQAA